MIFRALASALLTGSIILAAGSAPAQDTGTSAAPDGQTAPPTAADPTVARIKYLHDRLRITAEQEDLWDKVGQTIRDNERNLTPLRKERLRATTGGSALELLHAYDALGQTQLDSLKNIVTVFEPLYASLSESQKKIADAILRRHTGRADGSRRLKRPERTILIREQRIGIGPGDVGLDGNFRRAGGNPFPQHGDLRRFNRFDADFDDPAARRHVAGAHFLEHQTLVGFTGHNSGS